MEMMMKVSKFKLKLQTLITLLLEKQQQLDTHFQPKKKQKQSHDDDDNADYNDDQEEEEEELRRKIKHLEAELSSSTHLHQQLQRKVRLLEDDNYLLQTKHKQLTDTITTILQAKESFLNAYQESTCELKRSIESKDKKIAMLYEKINSHLLSIDSIRRKAYFVNQLVDNAQSVVNEKEEIGARLKIEMDKVCAFEKLFIEKIGDLETKLKNNEIEFQRKDRVIAELQAQLEMGKITDQCQLKIEELQETVQVKEGIIQTLISENKALRSELGMLEVTFKAIQDTLSRMDEEDRVSFSIVLANQEKDATEKDKEDDRIYHDIQHCEASSHQEASRGIVDKIEASPSFKEHDHIAGPLTENNNVNSCVSESGFPPPSSVHSESQLAANAPSAIAVEEKDDSDMYIQQLDSECSTTQA
uniref:nuclear mitotic apparatus protein 1 isoform X2 n=1 Tax=Erigeron canadensis TaxID=72917 RepID=UPI001CB9C645|nr:nuclear mitotic apparatus protein 1 isoform X2 [Erigeron canadensis]